DEATAVEHGTDPTALGYVRLADETDFAPALPYTSAEVFELFKPKEPSIAAKVGGGLAVAAAPILGPVFGTIEGAVAGSRSKSLVTAIPGASNVMGAATRSAQLTQQMLEGGKRTIEYHPVTSSLSVKGDSLDRFQEILSRIPGDRLRVDEHSGHIMVRI